MRHTLVLATALICASLPVICVASAAGKPHWSRIDFTESTHLGPMRFVITTVGEPKERRIERIRVWSNARELRVPMSDDMRVTNPSLHDIDVSYTASYSCFEDECPDIRSWPVTLFIPFGETIHWGEGQRPSSNSCDQSWLTIDVLADRVTEIDLWECTGTTAPVKILYEAK
jgi:hypothetical protein